MKWKWYKGLGVAGTAMLHCAMLMACLVGVVPLAVPLPVPPPVESLRITLAEPAAPFPATPRLAAAPEALAPVMEKAMPPAPAPPEEKTPRGPKPAQRTPRAAQAQHRPPQTAPELPPLPRQPDQEGVARARREAEARQTLLSALVARLEREKRYPTTARRLGIEGQVLAVVRVDSLGKIVHVSVKGGAELAILEKATFEALRRIQEDWKPVHVPEAMTLTLPVRYSLTHAG